MLPSWTDTIYALPTSPVTTGSFEFEARWRKAQPALTVTDQNRTVPTLRQGAAPAYRGSGKLRVVDAGTGTAADFAKVKARGALALVRRSSSVDPMTRARNAEAAGVALLGVVADSGAPVLEYVGQEDGTSATVPVVSIGQVTGTALLGRAAKALSVSVVGVPDSPYVYDLASPYPGGSRRRCRFRPSASQLATVEQRFHGTTSRTGGEFRWDYRPYRTYAFGLPLEQTMPATRTDYVSTQPGVQWAGSAVTGPDFEWVSVAPTRSLVAGKHTVEDWFGAVVRPANGDAFDSSTRYSGFLTFNVQPWADGGPGHAGYEQFDDTKHLVVSQDGKTIAESDWAQASLYPVEDGDQTYTLDLTTERDASVYRYSPRTRTVWQVHSPAITDGLDTIDLMPLLNVDFDVRTDLGNTVPGGAQSVGVSVHHVPGAVGAGTVGRPSVWFSYDDGAHWSAAKLVTAADGSTVARFSAPRTGAVSLRVSAKDDAGNAITQDVIRAYGLR